ncbi:4,5-DOPA dioxygenase extradiol [Burkholderiales bacterium]|nr:4,5-DOPA dioxygenase extradiol [Burkholderiales bacterium]
MNVPHLGGELPKQDMAAFGASSRNMPALFVGHGNPMSAIEDNPYSRAWRELGATLPRPRVILCISSHWETPGTRVTAMEVPPTLHDFGGFPQALFDVRYPAPGSPEWAARIARLDPHHPVALDYDWGLDHGCWSVLCRMFPKANIPVLQLSLDRSKTPAEHYQLGRALAPLREEGVLIVGSGNIVHNLRQVVWRDVAHDWAIELDRIVAQRIEAGDHAALIDYPRLHPKALLAVPTAEHYLPLLYILALQEPHEPVHFFNETVTLGALSMRSLQVGSPA